MLHDLEEIEELNINEGRIIELESKIGKLRNLEISSDRNAIRNILKEQEERENQLTKLKTKCPPKK